LVIYSDQGTLPCPSTTHREASSTRPGSPSTREDKEAEDHNKELKEIPQRNQNQQMFCHELQKMENKPFIGFASTDV
jgi:hypothetical protein